MQLATTPWLVEDTLQFQPDKSGSFLGSALSGLGYGRSRLEIAISQDAPAISIVGGSGKTTNKFLRGLTLQSIVKNTAASGIEIDGQCFFVADDLEIIGFRCGLCLLNRSPRSFSEFNSFSRIRLMENDTAVLLKVNGGSDSFHGNRFVQTEINIAADGIGLDIVGESRVAYVYNCLFEINFYGAGDSPSTAIRTRNINMVRCSGVLTGEKPMIVEALGSGGFSMYGHFDSGDAILLKGNTRAIHLAGM